MTTLEPIHPGEHLAEIMNELGITQYRLAKTIGVPPIRIHDIVHCRRSITADTALRIGQALGMTPDYWLNLQRMYDLDVARAKTDVSAIKPSLRHPPETAGTSDCTLSRLQAQTRPPEPREGLSVFLKPCSLHRA